MVRWQKSLLEREKSKWRAKWMEVITGIQGEGGVGSKYDQLTYTDVKSLSYLGRNV